MSDAGRACERKEIWNQRFLGMAHLVATWSKDPVRRVGAVVVTQDMRNYSTGYNGFPRGIEDDAKRLADPHVRRMLTVHAERNALDNARFGLRGCTMYTTKFPCHDCAKGIIQCGLKALVAPPGDVEHPIWGESFFYALTLMKEAGVIVFTRVLEEGPK